MITNPIRNVRLLQAFRRSPIDFLDLLVAGGASVAPLQVGPERVLLLDDPGQVWELLTVHSRRTQKGRGTGTRQAVARRRAADQ
jgi:hypothetical protein